MIKNVSQSTLNTIFAGSALKRSGALLAAAVAFMMTAACSTTTSARADTPVATTPAAAPQGQAGALTVTFTAIAQPRGALMVALFNSQAAYEGGPPVRGLRIPVEGASATLALEGLPPGEYAIKLYHDVNGDGQMNTNPFGLPTEPYAFSNNAKGRFGPAAWADAKFAIKAGANAQTITVAP